MSGAVRPIVIVSNRGPVTYRHDEHGELTARRGAGGLVTGLAPLVEGTDTMWIASALSDADREAARSGLAEAEGFRVRLLAHDPDVLRMAYDVVGNAVLWFVHHGLFELARRPRYDRHFRQAWDAYRTYNETFADAVVEGAPEGAVVLVQDYHLSLMAPSVTRRRPDLALVHFSHTPFAGPELLTLLPDPYRRELLEGMAGNSACGFHTDRWRRRFVDSCAAFGVAAPHSFIASLAPDPDDLRQAAASDACRSWQQWIDDTCGDVQLVVRVDRIELSKNILRGFLAFDELLERWPDHRGRVSFLASVYPSREGLAEYLAYRQEVEHVVERINERWATDSWQPVVLATEDDFPRSVAMLTRYDVLLVNPVSDGMNLVAKEGPQVNERHGALVLSTETGAWDELGPATTGVHPCDISATAEALHEVLSLDGPERRRRAADLLELATARTPRHWLEDQLAASEAAAGPASTRSATA
jgi:trehalose 6-phosphate synthase